MVRRSSLLIGLGLALLWWIGLSLDRSATMLWFNAVAALIAFAIAGLIEEPEKNPGDAFGPAMLGLGLAALWIIGIATHQHVWVTWANFLFAAACLAVAVRAVSPRHVHIAGHSPA